MNDFLTHTQKKKRKREKRRVKESGTKNVAKFWARRTFLSEESFIIIFTRERTNERTNDRTNERALRITLSLSLSLDFISKKKTTRVLFFCSRVSVGSMTIEIFFGLLPIENFSSFFIQKSS